MKIVYCINQIDKIGGTERITIAKANALSEVIENEVYVVVAYCNSISFSFSLNSCVHFINLDVHYFEHIRGGLLKRIQFVYRKKKEHKSKLLDVLNKISPDIVISTGSGEKMFLPSLRVSSKPVFIREMHFHKYFRHLIARSIYTRIVGRIQELLDYCWLIKKYDRIVVLTYEDKEIYWGNSDKVNVIPNPVTQKVTNISSLENKIVITAGRLVTYKNFESLISAWTKLKHIYPDWKLEIYGDGPHREVLKSIINKEGLVDQVLLCGFASNIMEKMQEASIFAFTSKCEGFGLVLIEAMICGLPVVSYDCPCGPKDIITEGKNGFLVHMNEENTLVDRISLLMSDYEKRKEMGKNAVERSRDFSMDRIIEMWMSLFKDLLKEKRGIG